MLLVFTDLDFPHERLPSWQKLFSRSIFETPEIFMTVEEAFVASEALQNENPHHENTSIAKHLYVGGFKYTLNRSTAKTLFYVCSSRRTKKNGGLCKARVNLDVKTGNAKQSGEHECSKVIQTNTLALLNVEKEV
jgi:hypothetical protein